MPLAYIGFWRTILLGTVNALVFTLVLYLAEKVTHYEGWPRVSFVWLSISGLLILCFAPTSYLLHRLFSRRLNSLMVLWVAIGVVSVCVWNGLFAAAVYWEIRQYNYQVLYYEITNPRNPDYGLFSLALVVVTNLIFGAVIKMLSQRHAAQLRTV